MRTRGSAQELERRRRLAVQRLQEGYSKAAVARFLGVHLRTVRRWHARFRAGGDDGLAAKPHPGRPRYLRPPQERRVLAWLRKNPQSFGFATELWSAPRLAQVIERKLRVQFHPRYLNAWLKQRGITPQKPERQARQRDQAAVEHWLAHVWPRIQNAPAAAGPSWP
jgi:transposase